MMKHQLLERITIDPDVCSGSACIRNMRMRVCDVLSLLANGASNEEILSDYPFLELKDIHAALFYAAKELEKTNSAST